MFWSKRISTATTVYQIARTEGTAVRLQDVSQPRWFIVCLILVFICLTTTRLPAQSSDSEYKGFTAYEQARASTSNTGQFVVLDTNIGYDFNKHFGMDIGIPVFFIRPTITGLPQKWTNELGDPYLDLRLTADNRVLNYATAITVAAPVHKAGTALSTGRVGVDWFNHFDRPIYRLTPFVNAGLANGIINTRLLSQPFRLNRLFQSLGFIADVEGGMDFRLARFLKVGGSYYALEPSGNQKIYGPSTVGNINSVTQVNSPFIPNATLITHDRGYSAWIRLMPSRFFFIEPGYSHSIKLNQDAATITVGLDFSSIFRRPSARSH
jgi:hypothetical protein